MPAQLAERPQKPRRRAQSERKRRGSSAATTPTTPSATPSLRTCQADWHSHEPQPLPPSSKPKQSALSFLTSLHTLLCFMGGRAFGPPLCRGCAPATPPSKTIAHQPYAFIPAVRLKQGGDGQPVASPEARTVARMTGLVKNCALRYGAPLVGKPFVGYLCNPEFRYVCPNAPLKTRSDSCCPKIWDAPPLFFHGSCPDRTPPNAFPRFGGACRCTVPYVYFGNSFIHSPFSKNISSAHFTLIAARTTTMPPVAIRALTMSSSGQETSCERFSPNKPHAKSRCGFSL